MDLAWDMVGQQAYANLIPAPTLVVDTGVGVGQLIVFQFTEPVTDKAAVIQHLNVTSNPPQPGAWYWIDNQDVHYRPEQFWAPGTTLTVSATVYGLDLGGGVYGAENNSATYRVHHSLIAKADGATEQLQVLDNGQLVKTMPMSPGAPGYPHPRRHPCDLGRAALDHHELLHLRSMPRPTRLLPGAVALDERISNDGEFVHSAPWSGGQQGNSNVSHGCVNLSPANPKWFYDHFGLGDVVEAIHSGGSPLSVWDLYGDWVLPRPQWQTGAGSAAH